MPSSCLTDWPTFISSRAQAADLQWTYKRTSGPMPELSVCVSSLVQQVSLRPGHQGLDFVVEPVAHAGDQRAARSYDNQMVSAMFPGDGHIYSGWKGNSRIANAGSLGSRGTGNDGIRLENQRLPNREPLIANYYFFFSVFTGIDRPTGTIAPREGSAAL